MIRIISAPSKENPFVVIDKPAALPSAPLSEDDRDNAFYECALLFPELLNVHGKKSCEHGLLHRLDTATRGLLVIAASDEAYNSLQLSQQNGLFEKTYTALIDCNAPLLDSFPTFPKDWKERLERGEECTIESYFRSFGEKGRKVRPVTADSGKAALKKCGTKLYQTRVSIADDIATCRIVAGYRHQVRCHLSWAGYAVKGDKIYNPSSSEKEMHFTASSIRFPHPLTNKIIEYSL